MLSDCRVQAMAEGEVAMFGFFDGDNRRGLLGGTIKAAAAIAFLSVLAANWLAGGMDRESLSRLAAKAARPDPTMTGSILKTNPPKLDPCTVR